MSIDDLMQRSAKEALQEPSPSDEHIDDQLLAAVVDGRARMDTVAREHLAQCTECRDILGHAMATVAPPPKRRGWLLGLIPVLSAAAVLIGLNVRDDGYQRRGGAQKMTSSVTYVVTDRAGLSREARADEVLHIGERLGFRYGNPDAHRSLTVLAWDGQRVHWYYPSQAGGTPFEVMTGTAALNRRLPEDIVVSADDYEVGSLTVVAAFDRDPAALAEQLRAGPALGDGQDGDDDLTIGRFTISAAP